MAKFIFKGRTKRGDWVYGDLIQYKSGKTAIFKERLSDYGYEATEICRRTLVDSDTVELCNKELNNKEIDSV